MYCPRCAAKVKRGATACRKCGLQFSDSQSTADPRIDRVVDMQYKGFAGGMVAIHGQSVHIKQIFLKEDCELNDILSVGLDEPTDATNGRLLIKTSKNMHTILFLRHSMEGFKELRDYLLKNSPNAQEMTEKPPLSIAPQSTTQATLSCPKCGGVNLQAMGSTKKNFSVGKAVGGAVLLGGVGALAGFAGTKGKYDMFCADCGNRFQVK